MSLTSVTLPTPLESLQSLMFQLERLQSFTTSHLFVESPLIPELGKDICSIIFSYLPAQLFPIFKLVNKSWKAQVDIKGKCDNYIFLPYCSIHGYLNLIKYATGYGRRWNKSVCTNAAKYGYLDILEYARKNGCEWDEEVCFEAAQSGNLHILKWARENGCPWDERTCSGAALSGNLEMLKWARENGCHWTGEVCTYAAMKGYLHIIKYARENRTDSWRVGSSGRYVIYAAKFGYLDILKYAREVDNVWHKKVYHMALKNGRTEIIKWLEEIGIKE